MTKKKGVNLTEWKLSTCFHRKYDLIDLDFQPIKLQPHWFVSSVLHSI